MRPSAFVALVDDHPASLDALRDLLDAVEVRCAAFASAEAFLASPDRPAFTCLVLDVDLPGMSGIELQAVLAASAERLPIIFLTSKGESGIRDRALAEGAACFLRKPVEGRKLLHWLDQLA